MSSLSVTEYHAGTGAGTLVLLHGFPVDRRMWDSMASLVDASWRVLGVDLPGLGASAAVLPEPASMAGSAQAVREALQGRSVSGAPVVFAGLSMGGYVV